MTKREIEILVVVALALALLGGGGYVVSQAIDRRRMAELLRSAAEARGVNPDIAEAIGRVESGLNAGAVNNSGPDAKRGGAWGATQITLRTAQAYGWTGTGEELLASPEAQADLTATILAAGQVETVEDAAAWWNAGRRSAADPRLPASTRTTYIPRLLAAYNAIAGASEAA